MYAIEELCRFYEKEGQEELRFSQKGVHELEFMTATLHLDKVLPPKAKVLDNCAGSGAYSFYLAGRGHQVTAGDIVPYNVEVIREKQKTQPKLAEIYEGDALDLSRFDDESFDAVLLMGVMYHFPEPDQRKRAVAESLRVLRRGGVFACTYMNRHAVILNNAFGKIDNIDEIMQFLVDGKEGLFYASTPTEVESLMHVYNVEMLSHVALDGVACLMYENTRRIDDVGLERWKRYHLATCTEPSLLGYSYHNMIIGKR